MRLWQKLKAWTEEPTIELPVIEKFGENLTPNMRALRLAMTMADQLLSMGVSANSVVSKTLDITEAYCKRPVHVDISANILMVSQLRGVEKEPLTLIRPVAMRDVNYMTIQDIQNLIFEIHKGYHTLDSAEEKFDSILKHPRTLPWWLIMLGNAAVVTGVTLMYTSSWQAIVAALILGICVDRLVAFLAAKVIPPFFRQIIVSMFIILAAAGINALDRVGFDLFTDTNPTLLVVGGVVLLVAGLATVAAVQDAIEEYYVTANARLAKVFMQTAGIVIGVLTGLYVVKKMGIGIALSLDPLPLNMLEFQVIGAMLSAAGYVLASQTRLRAILGVALMGGAAQLAVSTSVHWLGVYVVPASGIIAAVVGLFAAFISRFWHTPSIGIISGAIVPLVPGLMLYNSLMQLINYPPGDPLFFRAVSTLLTAITTALAIAAGASLGSMIGRPLRQKVAARRNYVPFADFMRRQLEHSDKSRLASLALARWYKRRDEADNSSDI